MPFKEEEGFIYTIDTVLALIPVFIILVSLNHISEAQNPITHTRLSLTAQDSLDIMTRYREGDGMSILEKIAYILALNHNNATGVKIAGELASDFFEKNPPGQDFLFTEDSQLGGAVLAGHLDLKRAGKVTTARRKCGNYSFCLYLGS